MEAIPAGAEVVDAEGERLGHVLAAAADYIVAERGFFFPTDFYIPREAIAEVSDATVRLGLTKADVLTRGWEVRPEAAAAAPAPGDEDAPE
jgi:hypothetical protein